MPAVNTDRIIAQVYAICGRPSPQELPWKDVNAAVIAGAVEVATTIATNPQHGDFGALATLVSIAHNAFIPAHDGEPGVPVIVPFADADAISGVPARPEQIDAYRATPDVFTGAYEGVSVPHDEADAHGRQSPLAGFYSIIADYFKFTGFSAEIPLVQLSRSSVPSGLADTYEPTIVKVALRYLMRPGAAWNEICAKFATLGEQDLEEIRKGASQVPPVPIIEVEQRAEAA